MKNNSIFSAKNNAFDGQFTDLNNNDMLNLRGGDYKPLPPTGGDDYPIDPFQKAQSIRLSVTSLQLIPTV